MGREPGSTTTPDSRPRSAVSITIQPPLPAQSVQVPVKSWRDRLRGPEGVSFTISLIVHVVFCIILAIPVIGVALHEDAIVTTIRDAEDVQEGYEIGAIIDAPVVITNSSMTADELLAPRLDEQAPYLPIPENAAVADSAAAPGDQDGESASDLAGAVGGYLLKEPENAVKAGRFTAFSRPILRPAIGKLPAQLGEPGDSPLAGQDYFIVIQLRVGEQRKTFPAGDLIGHVKGTDGYRQRYPERVYYLDQDGNPQPVTRSKSIKVINGIVQLLMQVKGAEAEVRDNIYLKSRLLKEEQQLELIFQTQRRQP